MSKNKAKKSSGAPYGSQEIVANHTVRARWDSFWPRGNLRRYEQRCPTGVRRIPHAHAVAPRMARPSPILGILVGGAIAAAAVTWQPQITAVDGDTVDHGFWRWRLAGYDTPETGSRARCPEERAAGAAAKVRLSEVLETETAVLVPLEPFWRVDRYNRRIGRLEVGGEDVAAVLIREGLARPYDGGRRQPWCPAP